jgi:hypothetical protein
MNEGIKKDKRGSCMRRRRRMKKERRKITGRRYSYKILHR